MASDDTVQQELEQARALFEEQIRQDETRAEETHESLFEQNEHSNSQAGDTESSSGGSDDGRSHQQDEELIEDPVTAAIEGNEPLEVLGDLIADGPEEEFDHSHGDHLDHADIFNAAATHQDANDYKWIKKAMVEKSGADTSFKTSFDKKGKEDEETRAFKNFQTYMAVKTLSDHIQNAKEFTGVYLENKYKELEDLNNEIDAKAAEVSALEESVASQEQTVADAEQSVELAETELLEAEAKIEVAEFQVEGARMGFDAAALELVNVENQSRVISVPDYDRNLDKMIFQNEDGTWIEGTFDESGNVVFNNISAEDAAQYQSNEFETDFNERGYTIENEDGTKTFMFKGSGAVDYGQPTEDQQKMLDAYEARTGISPEQLGASANDQDNVDNKITGAFIGESEATQRLTEAEQANQTAQVNLSDRLTGLKEEQAELQERIEKLDKASEEHQELLQKREALELKIEQAEEFQDKLDNGNFETEEDIIKAMPDELQKDYIAHYGQDFTTDGLDNNTNQIMYAQNEISTEQTATANKTATSYASELDGAQEEQLTSQTAFAAAADPTQPAPTTEPAPQDPALQQQQQQPQSLGLA